MRSASPLAVHPEKKKAHEVISRVLVTAHRRGLDAAGQAFARACAPPSARLHGWLLYAYVDHAGLHSPIRVPSDRADSHPNPNTGP